ncbi:MAG: hypothetical protein LPK15_10955 [Alteromonadaceae bacterium]|uniref:hypothetical protein n=1 Tax=Marinobacter sp. TaxID=50741 RepID=UPI0029C350BB|nr:hypothetical protein [Marinobacter sp.]MDX5385464.1 hypothetical protein [Marinobacter sp.]MDX5440946.1 hypothetical protein [Alteromonadaceae bacterium]
MGAVVESSPSASLKKALDQNNIKELLTRWAEQSFFTLFATDPSGIERVAFVQYGPDQAAIVTLDQQEAEDLVSAVAEHNPSVKPFVKTLPLWEIARLAHSDGGIVTWHQQGTVLEGGPLAALGHMALATSEEGGDRYYKITTLPLEGDGAEELAPGCLQHWNDEGEDADTDTLRLIYDDTVDWQGNPMLPDLPESAVPRSALSDGERRIFDRWATPVLGRHVPLTRDQNASHQPRLSAVETMPPALLATAQQFYELLEERLFNQSSGLKLEVAPTTITPIAVDDDGNEYEEEPVGAIRFAVQYMQQSRFGTGITSLKLYEETLRVEEVERMPYRLPQAPGLHPLPDALRGLLLRHISWRLCVLSRRLEDGLFFLGGHLRDLLSAQPDNSDSRFFSDPDDERFPFLAGFRCGENLVPVLVLGMQDGNYVCSPQQDVELDEEQVATELPQREFVVVDGVMTLWDALGSIVVPPALIEYPEPWYNGVRVSLDQTVSQTIRSLALLSFASQDDQTSGSAVSENRDNASDGKLLLKWMGAAAIVFVFVMILVGY